MMLSVSHSCSCLHTGRGGTTRTTTNKASKSRRVGARERRRGQMGRSSRRTATKEWVQREEEGRTASRPSWTLCSAAPTPTWPTTGPRLRSSSLAAKLSALRVRRPKLSGTTAVGFPDRRCWTMTVRAYHGSTGSERVGRGGCVGVLVYVCLKVSAICVWCMNADCKDACIFRGMARGCIDPESCVDRR